jgi:hypothetical protein
MDVKGICSKIEDGRGSENLILERGLRAIRLRLGSCKIKVTI